MHIIYSQLKNILVFKFFCYGDDCGYGNGNGFGSSFDNMYCYDGDGFGYEDNFDGDYGYGSGNDYGGTKEKILVFEED